MFQIIMTIWKAINNVKYRIEEIYEKRTEGARKEANVCGMKKVKNHRIMININKIVIYNNKI